MWAAKFGELALAKILVEHGDHIVQYAKIEDHANDVHDYLKYLKFGYGRATDDASMEIRHGRLTREEGIELVRQYDAKEPSTLGTYCEFLGITENDFYTLVEPMRDKSVWEKTAGGFWVPKDAIWKHEIGEGEEKARPVQVEDRTFAVQNRQLYYNRDNPPEKTGELALDQAAPKFKVL